MKKLALAFVLFASPVFAEDAPAPPQSPIETAMSQEISQQLGEIINLRAALIAERQKVEELQKQIPAKAKP